MADMLVWYRPERFGQRIELRRNQDAVATLTFDPPPAFAWEYTARHAATAETAGARWRLTVVRRGFLGLKADVHVDGANTGVLQAGYLLRRGTLTLSEMLDMQWLGGIERTSSDTFENLQGDPVIRFERGDYFERVNARVAVLAEATPPGDVALLASIGLYVRLLMNKVYR